LYRKHFTLKPEWAGRRVTLYFEGAMTTADLWVNDSQVPTHYGGFNPFCYEISKYCTFDGATDNLIAVRLNNAFQGQVPPESPNSGGAGNIDFELEGGIYRDVYLIVSDSLYIPEPVHDWANYHAQQGGQFIWYPSVSTSSASIQIETWVRNSSASSKSCQLAFSLVDSANTVVQTASVSGSIPAGSVGRLVQTMTVPNPSLWYPWSPKRYTMWTLLYDGTTPVDVYKVKIGIRRITWSVTAGASINGT
jgi:beta-galactosidase